MFSDTSYTNYKHRETLKGIFQCPQKLTNVIQTSHREENSLSKLSLRSLNKWYGVFAPQYYKFSQFLDLSWGAIVRFTGEILLLELMQAAKEVSSKALGSRWRSREDCPGTMPAGANLQL